MPTAVEANVRFARPSDIPTLKALDPWPRERAWRHKVEAQEVIALELTGRVAGLARYAVLWTTVPFLELIFIEEPYRGKGHSRRMLEFLKAHLRKEGYVALLSSSQTDEPRPQAWHVHMGFRSNGIIEHIADDNVGELVYRTAL
ncbi:hypothetical protein BH24DEI1_BH24DEI1_00150 [soil metagenome]|jgi:GNAT superfamily N-acetyltransferase|nr:GNAT family N-acetyltransferase [Deinococcota bacterium]